MAQSPFPSTWDPGMGAAAPLGSTFKPVDAASDTRNWKEGDS